MRNKHIVTTVSEQHVKMVAAIKAKLGYLSDADVMRNALVGMYKANFKDYLTSRGVDVSPEEKVRNQVLKQTERQRLVKEAEYARGNEICVTLLGDVRKDANGDKTCVYNAYTISKQHNRIVDTFEQSVPLDYLTEGLIDKQVVGGTIEDVMKIKET